MIIWADNWTKWFWFRGFSFTASFKNMLKCSAHSFSRIQRPFIFSSVTQGEVCPRLSRVFSFFHTWARPSQCSVWNCCSKNAFLSLFKKLLSLFLYCFNIARSSIDFENCLENCTHLGNIDLENCLHHEFEKSRTLLLHKKITYWFVALVMCCWGNMWFHLWCSDGVLRGIRQVFGSIRNLLWRASCLFTVRVISCYVPPPQASARIVARAKIPAHECMTFLEGNRRTSFARLGKKFAISFRLKIFFFIFNILDVRRIQPEVQESSERWTAVNGSYLCHSVVMNILSKILPRQVV